MSLNVIVTLLSNNKKSHKKKKFEAQKLFMQYGKWSSEQLKRVANKYGIEVMFAKNCR